MNKHVTADQKRLFGVISIAASLVVLVIILAPHFMQPSRSVAAYCNVYAQEKARLGVIAIPQAQYPSATFDVSVNDAGQIASSLAKLDKVAPSSIEPDVKSLQKLYQEVHDNPALDVQASLSGESIDNSLKSWT